MATPYTKKNLKDVKDSAPDFGFGEHAEIRFAGEELDAEDAGFTYHYAKPDTHGSLGHRHQAAEEVYVVIAGSGRAKLDDEIVELERLDTIRVAPEVWRAFSAGPDGLEMIAFGARHENDGEIDPNWWTE